MNIKHSSFPFVEGETFAAGENNAPTSMYIADIHKLMLVVINRYLLLTREQLSDYLLHTLGLTGMQEKDIYKQLWRLVQSNFLTAYRFRAEDGTPHMSAYGLGYRGKGLLRSMKEAPRLTNFVAQLDPVGAKKILACNQYLIRSHTDLQALQVCKTLLVQGKNIEKTHLIVRTQGLVSSETETHLIEAVRRAGCYLDYLAEKLERLDKVLQRKTLNYPVTAPRLTLICEDEDQLETVSLMLRERRYGFDIFCTTDAAVFADAALAPQKLVTASRQSALARLFGRLFRAA